MSRKIALDQYDYGILEILQKDASITNKELAKQIGLSPPATLVRVNHLKSEKHLLTSQYRLNWHKLGFNFNIHIYCTIEAKNKDSFLKLLDALPQVLRTQEAKKSEIFILDYKHCSFIMLGVFRSQDEFQKVWTTVFASSGFIVTFEFLRVEEERVSSLPVPLIG